MKKKKSNMKKMVLTMVAMVFSLGIATSTTAFAVYVDGGTWHYGVGWTGTYGYSNYYHGSRSHTATVRNGGHSVRERQSAGYWARASIDKIPPTGMEYFYGF